jgi:hypothetical protein
MGRACNECGDTYFAKGKCRLHYRMPSQLNPKPIAKAVKPISQVSSKQAKLNRAYMVIRNEYMKGHEVCEAKLPGCTYHATDLHHKNGRGSNLLDATTYIALCRSCHQRAENAPNEAKRLGISGDRL